MLHTSLQDKKQVTWLELLYDLIFAAAVIQLGGSFAQSITESSWLALARFFAHFIPLIIAWLGLTFYANRFDHDDLVQRLLTFAMMFAVGAMAVTGPVEQSPGDNVPRLFALAFAMLQVLILIMYLRVWRQTEEARAYALHWGLIFAAGTVFWTTSVFLPHGWYEVSCGVGVLIIFGAPMSQKSRTIQELFPTDQAHLSERFGLVTITVLGISFVKMLGQLSALPANMEFVALTHGAQYMLITSSIWWIYFDDVAGVQIRAGRGNWIIWLYAHVPLIAGIVLLHSLLGGFTRFDRTIPPPNEYRWLLTSALAMVLLSVSAIESVTIRAHVQQNNNRLRAQFRIAAALVVLAIGPAGGHLSTAGFLLLIVGICTTQVLFDLTVTPFTYATHEPTFSLEAHKVQQAEQGTTDNSVRPPYEAIRKGAPDELKSDFYYFFLESSWARLFLVFGAVFLLINVLFAALYMLQPNSIGGQTDGSFLAAFSFSLQTISTIGYGAMSPATTYGDFIVLLESVTGILTVAVSTGIVFAKISRPGAAVIFSNTLILAPHDGKLTLMLRVGNARSNELIDAKISITLVRDHVTLEGQYMRRLVDVPIVRSHTPFFALTWTVMHTVDESSPFYGLDWSHPEKSGISLIVVSLVGHDATYGQTAYTRKFYTLKDLRVNHRFIDVLSVQKDGRLVLDYAKLHDTQPIESED